MLCLPRRARRFSCVRGSAVNSVRTYVSAGFSNKYALCERQQRGTVKCSQQLNKFSRQIAAYRCATVRIDCKRSSQHRYWLANDLQASKRLRTSRICGDNGRQGQQRAVLARDAVCGEFSVGRGRTTGGPLEPHRCCGRRPSQSAFERERRAAATARRSVSRHGHAIVATWSSIEEAFKHATGFQTQTPSTSSRPSRGSSRASRPRTRWAC